MSRVEKRKGAKRGSSPNRALKIEEELDSLRIFPKARIYKTKLTKKFKERKGWIRPDLGEVKSVIPGTVTSIEVALGDMVESGTPLLRYEAMKMQNIVVAPIGGEVVEISVVEGERCPKGKLLIAIKGDEEERLEEETNDGDLGLIV